MSQCRHERYHDGHHMTGKKIERITKSRSTNNLAWISARITTCEDCGADISEFDVHKVMTAAEYVELYCVTPEPGKQKRKTSKDRLLEQKIKLEAAGQQSLL